MMRLSELKEDTDLSQPLHARYPGSHCAFFGVSGMVPLIKNSVALMIGPAVCLYNAKLQINLRSLTSDPRPDNLRLLLLGQDDTIFGAHEKVKQGILEAVQKYDPEVLFIVTTCTQEIIGEDFDAAVQEIQSKVRARLLLVHTDNFTCEDASPGLERTYLALSDLMKKDEVMPGSVNLLGLRAPAGRRSEPVQLFKSHGITVKNVIPANSTPAEISEAPQSELNIVMEHHALPLAKAMDQRFGTPYIYTERAFTPEALETDYLRIAAKLGIDMDEAVAERAGKTRDRIRDLKDRYSGKTFIMGIQQGRSFDLARLLVRLGMKPLALFANRILDIDREDIRKLLEDGVDPFILKSGDALSNDALVKDLKPDYFIGHGDRVVLARLNIQARSLMRAFMIPGFAGTDQVLALLGKPLTGASILYYKEGIIANEGGESWTM